jgi:D-glycerate 3-kinase
MTVSWLEKIRTSQNNDLWDELTRKLETILDESIRQNGLIEDYYLPLFFYLNQNAINAGNETHFIGINAPQGGGKTTLTNYLVQLFAWTGKKAVTLSIDDFYLTREGQISIADANPDNRYLQQRGYPGTHDIQLGIETLGKLKTERNTQTLLLPRYDKSRHSGKGDRADKSQWHEVSLPVDIVLVEGWMLGFQKLPPERIQNRHLSQINSLLVEYQAWHRFLDDFVYLYPENPGYVIAWRSEAEARMKARGLPGMTSSEVRNYAEMFLPAYELYGPVLTDQLLPGVSSIKIEIGKNRLPVIQED